MPLLQQRPHDARINKKVTKAKALAVDRPVMIPIHNLLSSLPVRATGVSVDHVDRLIQSFSTLPPITVNSSMDCVIDGRHRLQAARQLRHDHIAARILRATDEEALVFAIEANSHQGLPLTLKDRKQIANQLLTLNPALSDRAVAHTAGVSPGCIRKLRLHRPTAQNEQLTYRVGRDGRRRHVKHHRVAHPSATAKSPKRADASITGRTATKAQQVDSQDIPAITEQRPARQDLRTTLDHRVETAPQGRGQSLPPWQLVAADPALKFSLVGKNLIAAVSLSMKLDRCTEGLSSIVPSHLRFPVAAYTRRAAVALQRCASRLEQ